MRSKDVTSGAVRDAAQQAGQVAKEQAAVAAQIAREQGTVAAQAAAQVAREQAAQAAVLARNAAEKAVPKVGAAVEWASPRIEKGLLAAGPAVGAAAERMVPAVDAARDRIVQDLLPRIVEAVTAAAAAGATAQRVAAGKVSSSLESAAEAVAAAGPAPEPSHRARRILIFGTIAAAGAAGLAAYRRSRSTAPQWDALSSNEPAFTGGPEPTPPTLADPVPPSVTEQPLNATAPETTTGDPVLDGLGTAEMTTSDPVEVVEVIEVEAAPIDEPIVEPEDSIFDEPAGDDESKPSGRRRKE